MLVIITQYSPVTGKGTYECLKNGKKIPFFYKDFLHQRMIPVGGYAELKKGILIPAHLTRWRRFKMWAKKLLLKEVW